MRLSTTGGRVERGYFIFTLFEACGVYCELDVTPTHGHYSYRHPNIYRGWLKATNYEGKFIFWGILFLNLGLFTYDVITVFSSVQFILPPRLQNRMYILIICQGEAYKTNYTVVTGLMHCDLPVTNCNIGGSLIFKSVSER